MNILRNWVGMIGDEELNEACDRHGIMIWQDFWLANPADGPDPYYPDLFITNATATSAAAPCPNLYSKT